MKLVVFLSTIFLISSSAFAQSKDSKITKEARLSINAEEIKIAHARLLAAEAELKNEVAPKSLAKSEVKSPAKSINHSTSTSTINSSDESPTKITKIKASNGNLNSKKIATLEAEKARLQKELNFSKDRLLVAETEVERLQGLIENRTRKLLSPVSTRQEENRVSDWGNSSAVAASPLISNAQKEKASGDMPIITVTAKKANLRIGPSEADSPLMEVAVGTRLVVETRIGEWYRIIAPTGVRAWISAKVVAFGDTGTDSPSRVTRISGFDNSMEDEAFGLIASLSK